MTTIYLVRHGQASFGSANYDELSPLGHRQSELLGRWWRQIDRRVESVALGAMKRHRQTAQACLQGLIADAVGDQSIDLKDAFVEPGFNEYDHEAILRVYRPDLGEHAAMRQFLAQEADPKRAFQQLFSEAVARWTSGRHDADYAESWAGFKQRCQTAVQQVAAQAQERGHDSVAVFTSGGPIAAITQAAMDAPDAQGLELAWSLMNASVTQVGWRSGKLRLAQFNNIAHLDVTRDPALRTYR